ncbi:hypothetical protein GUA87_10535 [Sneathiella sp. P13V-1]|uniref:hypothetical protein n=1 Tax=Sneathiella sp. P13V-1 TaxID=2697366 RepID=UPI00187B977A|nr:hypothetical protein [Sneathiella sp. P13V-1]MBE7637282.1 hypothetical protein [Sneathiella sp. P13V-1]
MRSFLLFITGFFFLSFAVYLGLGLYTEEANTANAVVPKKIWLATVQRTIEKGDFLSATDLQWTYVEAADGYEEFVSKESIKGDETNRYLALETLEIGELVKTSDILGVDNPDVIKLAVKAGHQLTNLPEKMENSFVSNLFIGESVDVYWVMKEQRSNREVVLKIGTKWRVLKKDKEQYMEIPKDFVSLYLSIQRHGKITFLRSSSADDKETATPPDELTTQIDKLLAAPVQSVVQYREIRIHRGTSVTSVSTETNYPDVRGVIKDKRQKVKE